MNEENGGPAFPVDQVEVHGRAPAMRHPGMSLRDYFAAMALNSALAIGTQFNGEWDVRRVAELAYAVADAMLKERGE